MKKKESFLDNIQYEILSLVLGYAILVGFIYNFFQFNIGLDFNIFDYVSANDMIFSWIIDSSLISFLIILIFVLIIKFMPNETVLIVISLISLVLIPIVILTNKNFGLNEMILVLVLVLVSIIFYTYLFIKNYKLNNNDDVNSIEKIIKLMNIAKVLFRTDKEIKNCEENFKLNILIENYNYLIKKLFGMQKLSLNIEQFKIEKYIINLSDEINKNLDSNPLIYWKVYVIVCNKILYNLDYLLKMEKSIENEVLPIYKKVEGDLKNGILIANNNLTEMTIVISIFLIVPSLFGYIEGMRINKNCVNVANIKLIRDIDPDKKTNQIYKIYKITSNYTIVKEAFKKDKMEEPFMVFNNSDISFIKFINKDKDTTCIENKNNYLIEEKTEIDNYKFQEMEKTINNIVTNSLNNYYLSKNFELSVGSIIIPQINSLLDTKFDFTAKFDKLFEYNKYNNGINFKYKDRIIKNEKIYFEPISFNFDAAAEIELNKIIKNIKNENKYIINLVGNSSIEEINIKNNTIKDNYTLSLARANSIKRYLLSKLIELDLDVQNIEFNIYGNSNQNLDNKNKSRHDLQRFVEMDILEFTPVSIDKRN